MEIFRRPAARPSPPACSNTYVRYLILSDIHANWEALQAVLEHARGRYDAILCCGDLVGYGADPEAVVDWARRHVQALVRGNHDKAAIGLEDIEWFNPAAAFAAQWTQRQLSPASLEYLRQLPRGPVRVNDFQILHGSPVDEDDYLISPQEAAAVYGYLAAPVSFFGHSHLQGGFLLEPAGATEIGQVPPHRTSIALELPAGRACLINPGSVGQPRDGDPRAAYAIYVPEERRVTFYRVPYDVAAAQRKILQAGLPEALALRLAYGS